MLEENTRDLQTTASHYVLLSAATLITMWKSIQLQYILLYNILSMDWAIDTI